MNMVIFLSNNNNKCMIMIIYFIIIINYASLFIIPGIHRYAINTIFATIVWNVVACAPFKFLNYIKFLAKFFSIWNIYIYFFHLNRDPVWIICTSTKSYMLCNSSIHHHFHHRHHHHHSTTNMFDTAFKNTWIHFH